LLSAARPYGRPLADDGPHSVGSPTRFVGRTEVAVATVTALAIAAAVGVRLGGAASAAVVVIVVLWGAYCHGRIGGITGDTVGAVIELSECAVLLLYAAGIGV